MNLKTFVWIKPTFGSVSIGLVAETLSHFLPRSIELLLQDKHASLT